MSTFDIARYKSKFSFTCGISTNLKELIAREKNSSIAQLV